MAELTVEGGVKESFKKKLGRSRLKLTGHLERMGDRKMVKRANAQKVEGKGRRGRPRMRWEDCVKRELERVGEEWRTTAKDRRSWRLVKENVVRESEDKNRRKYDINHGQPLP